MGCAPEESNLPRPIGSLCRKKLASTTDRRVVKLEIRDNRASIVIEQASGYVASEVIVVLRYEGAARSVGGIERRPEASPTRKSHLPAQRTNGWFCQFGRPFVEVVSTL